MMKEKDNLASLLQLRTHLNVVRRTKTQMKGTQNNEEFLISMNG